MDAKLNGGGNGKGRIYAAWAAVGMFVLTVLVLISNYAWQDYRRGISEAVNETQHGAAILSEQLGRTFAEAMLLLDTVDQELGFTRRLPFSVPDENLQMILEEKFLRFRQIEAVAVLNAGGKPVLEAGEWEQAAEGINLPSIFAQMRYHSGTGVVVTPPFKHGDDGMWRIALVQRRANSRGSFEGAIAAVLDPTYFQDNLAAELASQNVGLTFLQTGSIVLGLGQAANDGKALSAGDGRLFPNDLMTGQVGTFETVLAGTAESWIVSYRRLPEGGLIVGAAITKQSVIDAWLGRRKLDALIGGTSLIVILGLFVYAMHQIGHRMRAEGAAQQAETHLSDGIESMPEGFVLFDGEDRLVLCNPRLGEIYPDLADTLHQGVHRSDIRQIAVERGIYADALSAGSERWIDERIPGARQQHGISEHLLGSGRWIQVSEHRTRDGGTIALHADITDRKQREVALEAAKTAAEQASKAKSEFLAMISHELRTPLNAVIGFSELMRMETLGPLGDKKYLDYARDINDSGEHLLQIINDILDLSKAEAGQLELHEEILDVHGSTAKCIRIVQQRAADAGTTIRQAKENAGITLFADARAFKQILFNLLSNAIKFTPNGGGIEVRLTLDGQGDLRLTVADEGIGMDEEDIPRVLAPFQQVDSELSRQFEGTGLGLPLVKHLAEMHGGELEIESTVGVGTTVTVRFPEYRVSPDAAAA